MIFPDNGWLDKQWWHRLAKVVRVIFILFFVFVGIYYLSLPIQSEAMGIAVKICSVVSFLIAIFGFPVIYRILLYIFVSDWKDRSKNEIVNPKKQKSFLIM